MTHLVLCNMGGREVMLRNQGVLEELRPARPRGEEVWLSYERYAPSLELPILKPALDYILSRGGTGAYRLVLFATDQLDEAAKKTDTLYFARIAARRIPELFGDAFGLPQTQPVEGINPALYDETFAAYDELLRELRSPEVETCTIILAGGTPACNAALLLQGVRYFGERLQAVYPPQGGEPHSLRIGRQVMAAFRQAAASEQLRRMDFANALPYLEELEVQPGLRRLVMYAARRFAFDFHAAQDALETALEEGDAATRQFIRKHLRHSLDTLLSDAQTPQRLLALLVELYWNAAITYQHHGYADFLGRTYRFQEAVLRYLVETIYGLSTDLGSAVRQQNQSAWEVGIQADARLLAHLESSAWEGKPLDWRVIGRPVYKAMLAYALHDESRLPLGERERCQALVERINRLDRLVELRHRTIIGHDFQGVSHELLQQACPKGHAAPPDALAEIMRMLGQDMRQSVYHQIAEFTIANL
jgi:hypothetical protein